MKKVEKILHVIVAGTILAVISLSLIPRKTIYGPYRDAFVIRLGKPFDLVYFDGQVFNTEHDDERVLRSIIGCRRRYKESLFSKKEVLPECGTLARIL